MGQEKFIDIGEPVAEEEASGFDISKALKLLGSMGVRGYSQVKGAAKAAGGGLLRKAAAGTRLGSSILGAEGMLPGAVIGGGGEAIAQMIENGSLDPSKLNKSAIAASAALSAIPTGGLIKGANALAKGAIRGGLTGYGATALMKGVQDNPETGKKEIFENPNKVLNPLSDGWSKLDIAGVGLGAAAGGFANRAKAGAGAAAGPKSARDIVREKIMGEGDPLKDFRWGKEVYQTPEEAQEIVDKLANHPTKPRKGEVMQTPEGWKVVTEGSIEAKKPATALRVRQNKKAKEAIEKMAEENPEDLLDDAHTETITYIDDETGAKVTRKVKRNTPLNQRRQTAIQEAKEAGLESRGKTVTERTTAQSPEGTQTASETFAKPAPKNPAGGGNVDPLPNNGDTITADELGLTVTPDGTVVPEEPALTRPSMLEPIEEAPQTPVVPEKPKKGGKKGTALKVGGKKAKGPEAPPEPPTTTPVEPGPEPPVAPSGAAPEAATPPETPTQPPITPEPMRKSSRFYKQNPELLEKGKAAVETELAGMPDPTGASMPVSEAASPELRALAARAAKLQELYGKHQTAFKAGQVTDEIPAASATLKQGLAEQVGKQADVETAALLKKDLDEIAANDAIADGRWDGVERRTGTGAKLPELRRLTDVADEMAAKHPALQKLADRIAGRAKLDPMTGETIPVAGREAGPIDLTDSKYDYSQPMMTLREVAEATGTPMRTLERAISLEAGNPKRLRTVDLTPPPEPGAPAKKTRSIRRIPVEWLNEWIANGNGGAGRRGRPPLNNQIGEIDPRLLASMGTGAAGSVAGANYDEENPLRGAILGGLAGAGAMYAAPKAVDALDRMDKKLMANEVTKSIPDVMRGNLLSPFDTQFANAVVGPVGSQFWAGLERYLAGDPRGLELIKQLRYWAPDMYDNLKKRRAAKFIADAERSELSVGDSTNPVQRFFSLPGEVMSTGDLTSNTMAQMVGYSPEEARRITLQAHDLNYATPRALMNFGRTRTPGGKFPFMTKMLLPFKNTAANILDNAIDRTPFLGQYANSHWKDLDRRDSQGQITVKQGLGAGVGTIAYMIGRNVDPQNAAKWRRYVSNAAGGYSSLANAGFSAGLVSQAGGDFGDQTFAAGSSAIGDFPLGSTRMPMEQARFVSNVLKGNALEPGLHPEKDGLARYLPHGFYPGVVQEVYESLTDDKRPDEDFGIAAAIRQILEQGKKLSSDPAPLEDVTE